MAYRNVGKKAGINLEALRYWGRAIPFTNVLKGGLRLIDYQPSGGGTWDAGRPIDVDENGYPASLLADQHVTLLFASNQAINWPGGTYTLKFDGDGGWNGTSNTNISVANFGPVVSEIEGQIEVSWTPDDGNENIRIVGVNVADPIVNMRLLLPGFAAEAETFHPDFLTLVRNFSAIRFMNWQNINNSKLTSAADVTPVAAISYGDTEDFIPGGCPVEVMVALCNATDADMWYCVHHEQPGGLITSDAVYIAANLSADLRVLPEYSNETWNGGFVGQKTYCDAQGLLRGLDLVPAAGDTSADPLRGNRRFHSEKTQEVHDLFMVPFADANQVVKIMGAWEGSAFNNRILMDWPHTTTGIVGSAAVDKLATANYFGGNLGRDPQAVLGPPVAPNTKVTVDMTAEEVIAAALIDGESRMAGELGTTISDAAARGLGVFAYESGQHLVGVFAPQNDVALTALFTAANQHANMEPAYLARLNAWSEAGGELNCGFTLTNAAGKKTGNWGYKEYQSQGDTPKWLGFQSWLGATPPPLADSVLNVLQTESGEQLQTESGETLDTGGVLSFSLDLTPLSNEVQLASISKGPLTTESSLATIEFVARISSEVDLPIGVAPTQLMPSDRPFLQVGETGRKLILRITWEGQAFDLSKAKRKDLILVSPAGVEHRLRGSLESNGLDGQMFRVLDGVISSARGNWQIQADLDTPQFKGKTSVGWLTVGYNAS